MFKLIVRPFAIAALSLGLSLPAAAQNLFAPVVTVNGAPITEFEVQQRQRFMQLLGAPGSDRKRVIETMIDERLRDRLVQEVGVSLAGEDLQRALSDFAARGNLSLDDFIKALERAGVAKETLRDFVASGVMWRDYIRARYGNRVQITDDEIDRELAQQGGGTDNIQVLVSEIIIPAPPRRAAQVNALADEIAQSTSVAQFSSYARRYSATASRGRGGQLPWQSLNKLPPALHPIIMGLAPGEVSAPLPIPNAIALFQLRDIREVGERQPSYSEIEYAAYYMRGGRSEATLQQAENLKAEVDVCKDLYAYNKGGPESALEVVTKKPGDIPKDFAIELSKLDEGEVSTALTRENGQALVFLMLCKRVAGTKAEMSREDAAGVIRQRRLGGLAERLIEQERAEARIVYQ